MKPNESERFRELLAGYNTAVLITHNTKPGFVARPMAIAGVEPDCTLWFITGYDSAKVHEIAEDTRVMVVCQNSWSSCVSISGRALLVRDEKKIEQLWNTAYKAWFPKGPTDPNIVLIRVMAESGEYWDNTGMNAVTYAYQTVKAMVTGTPPEVKEGAQHGRMNLKKK